LSRSQTELSRVAITLLALNLPIPSEGTPRLAHYLGNHWPNFVSFVISFLTIGVVWVNHHATLSKPHLLQKDLTPQARRLILRRNSVGLLPYAAGVAAAALTPCLSLAICGAVAIYYALPGTTEVDAVERPPS
jgi:uncharacterized membrane protein